MTYVYKEVVTSTQTELLTYMEDLPHLTILSAGFQTEGHGQFDRTWESSANQNILCSILVKDVSMRRLSEIQKEVSITIVHYLKKWFHQTTFKEPNDILINGKKIGGVIVESKTKGSNVIGAVIGFGLNINQSSFQYKNATSFYLETQQVFDLKTIEQEIIELIIALF